MILAVGQEGVPYVHEVLYFFFFIAGAMNVIIGRKHKFGNSTGKRMQKADVDVVS